MGRECPTRSVQLTARLLLLDVFAEALSPVGVVSEGGAEARLVERNSRRFEPCVRSRTAPGPVERVVDEVRLDRVPGQVAGRVHEVCVALDLARERVGAEEMRLAVMAPVVVAGVLGMQLLERSRDARIGDSQERVVVVAKKDVRDKFELEPPPGGRKPLEEVVAVDVVYEEEAVVAAMRPDVVDAFSKGAQAVRHASSLGAAQD